MATYQGYSDTSCVDSKRGRATRDQLSILEGAFAQNSQPNAKTREQLAKRCSMTERSVQIWFQNRRAKIKMGQRKAHMALKEEALRQHCMAAYTNRISALPNQVLAKTAPLPDSAYFSPNPSLNYHSSPYVHESQSKTAAFPCSIISIGSWKRMPMGHDDLVCGFNLESKHCAWVIGDNATRFRIGFSFSQISRIELSFLDSVHAELSFFLQEPPTFSVLHSDKRWSPCADFTESSQASTDFHHVLIGEAQGMRVQLLKLIEAEHRLSTITSITNGTSTPMIAATPQFSLPPTSDLIRPDIPTQFFPQSKPNPLSFPHSSDPLAFQSPPLTSSKTFPPSSGDHYLFPDQNSFDPNSFDPNSFDPTNFYDRHNFMYPTHL